MIIDASTGETRPVRSEHVDHDDWSEMPPDPPDLGTAVKDYLVWLRDHQKPLDHRFQAIKSRIIFYAIRLVEGDGKKC